MVSVGQQVKPSDCESENWEFEPPHLPQHADL